MLKSGGTTIYIFRLHQRIGDYVLGAHNKGGWAGTMALPMGFPIWIDELIAEGNRLVNSMSRVIGH